MILTVDELKQELSVFPDDCKIMIEMDGKYVYAQGISLETTGQKTWVTISDFPDTD